MTSVIEEKNIKIGSKKKEPKGIILCGSCQTEMAKLPKESVNLTVTSPPYDNIRDYKGYCFEDEDFKKIVSELYRIT